MTVRDTSIKTYNEIIAEGLLGDRQVEVYQLLEQRPDMTDMEITKALGQEDPNYARPRRKELLDMGLIESSGKRRCSITHREVYQWRIIENAPYKKLVKVKDRIECRTCKGKGWVTSGGFHSIEEVCDYYGWPRPEVKVERKASI